MFFLLQQKTAYEMRISDWSSDVCSSDRTRLIVVVVGAPEGAELAVEIGAFVAVLGTADEVHRIGPGLLADLQHLVADLVDRLIPADLLVFAVDQLHRAIGRASCRERVCKDVWISVCAV